MSFVPLIVVGALAVGLAIAAILLALQSSKLKTQLEEVQVAHRDAREQADTHRIQTAELQRQVATLNADRHALQRALEEEQARAQATFDEAQQSAQSLLTERREKEEFLDHQDKEIEWLRAELEKRPKVSRKTYKILTLGVSGTGKTALTLKWANPHGPSAPSSTKIERYERTVSHVAGKDNMIEHVFEIGDWGGEHIVDAQQELTADEIHGLSWWSISPPATESPSTPRACRCSLREFQPESLKFFFGPKTIASCKSVVLFITKSDVLPGTPRRRRARGPLLTTRSSLTISIASSPSSTCASSSAPPPTATPRTTCSPISSSASSRETPTTISSSSE
ncbi:MAG: hypothetical protein R3F14_24110 [Polyangiaceae bacterium]